MDLLRPLQLAGIPCIAVAPADSPVHFSRLVSGAIEWADPWSAGEDLLEHLRRFGQSSGEAPVLFYEEDRDLLFISRERDRLAPFLRFAIADPVLVEALVDKAGFHRLAERLSLPVPRGQLFSPLPEAAPSDVAVRFPAIAKPLTRRDYARWGETTSWAKAIRFDSEQDLRRHWPTLRAVGLDVILQELVPGPETWIESYHVYVDESGLIAGEFTGRKIRTRPREYGYSTAVEITRNRRLSEVGRDIISQLGLRGVAKLDFKRTSDGRYILLEVNPRFTLWHHPAALAGVNIPALVYCDLTGRPRPPATVAQPGVRWIYHLHDAVAAREQGVALWRWLPWAIRTPAKSTLAWNDPMPFLRGVGLYEVRRRLGAR
jgi:predicted ATP-grasp superfamily ATP-dependent carboligase